MKKHLVALAVLGVFAGSAAAQSSVTLYGIIDVNMQWNDGKAPGPNSVLGVNGGHRSGSRLGFRGTEDLGGGVNAIFNLETGYNPDLGTLGQSTSTVTRLFGRVAIAGLQGKFGTLVLGRVGIFSSNTGPFDMWGPINTGWELGSAERLYSSGGNIRFDNVALYRTPNWGGFQGGVAYSPQIGGTEVTPASDNVKGFASVLSYGIGPFYGVATYDIVRATRTQETQGRSDQKHLQVGATLDFKVVKLHAGYGNEKNLNGNSTTGTANGADATVWHVGVGVPIGSAVRVQALYGLREEDTGRFGATAADNAEAEKRVASVNVSYSLSRRTTLYASFADSDAKQRLNNSAQDARQATLGMQHNF